MKVFEDASKVNFVDENNVFVGYDMGQCCCEAASWAIVPELPAKTPDASDYGDLTDYRFDDEWFRDDLGWPDLDEGDAVAFRLVAPNKPHLYLCLWNAHNGYYSHGFDMTVGGEQLRSGSL